MKEKKLIKEEFMTKTIVIWLGATLCCALWGSAFPCIKIGYTLFSIPSEDTAAQILFAGYRFTLAGIFTIVIGSVLNRGFLLPKKDSAGKIIWLSMLQTVAQYIFFYIGLAHTTGVKASIIEAVNVFIAILVASLFFQQEELTVKKMSGCAAGFLGVVLANVTKGGLDTSLSFTGEGFIMLSTVAYAFSSVYLKQYSKKENPVVLSGYQFVSGGIIMSLCGIMMGGNVDGFHAASTAMLVYLALVSAVAYSLWGILLKYNPISRVAVFGFMNPVFGVILSALLLPGEDQALGIKSIAALVLVCVGIYVVNHVGPEKGRLWADCCEEAYCTGKESRIMDIEVRAYQDKDLPEMIRIWNEVVEDGIAFPQEELLNDQTGKEFFTSQTYNAVAVNTDTGQVCGLYILHPNNVGRCGHICNASYAVHSGCRGLHIGEKLVSDCLVQGKRHGFRVLQFNAVVASNIHARHLYERLGFVQLGTIPEGFRMKDGHYEDICPYYKEL